MPPSIEDLRKAFQRHADRVERKVLVASEGGLFGKLDGALTLDGTLQHAIVSLLTEARKAATNGSVDDIYAADEKVTNAQLMLDAVMNERPSAWKYLFYYRGWLVLYQALLMAILLGIVVNFRVAADVWFPSFFKIALPARSSLFAALLIAAAFGALGAALRSLYGLHSKIATSEFYDRFVVAHVAAPFIGAILGVLAYLFFAGGAAAVADAGSAVDSGTSELLYALALAAGFGWEDALQMLASLTRRMSGGGTSRKSAEPEQSGAPREAGSTAGAESGNRTSQE